ncbi:cyclopropane-fatty-acyl-phospholipid synthase family protein [Massilia sp. Mn16-1_5]|uniref:SAM-dependent methyltransferase n=1 Tax=Massilia sp. Mn16-1_5 TaxID=2079199 RepID=UPI001E43D5AE|nr:class I SAM-dependent methyltransferase [Massilia sp. Mn16-1_5]
MSVRLLRAPSVRALLCQLAAFPLTLLAVYLLARAGLQPSYLHAALLQGLFAAILTWRWRLASWWIAIGLLFAPALYAANGLALPSWLFLAVFLFMLVLYWSTFRTQVPYYPSGKSAWAAVAGQLPQGREVKLIDIGSGLGGLVLDLARRPGVQATGIELAPLPWLASWLRARLSGSPAVFIRGDYELLEFGAYDAVFAYLSPAAMTALWRKAKREMRPGSMLMSYEFTVSEASPSMSLYLQDTGRTLYIWHF